MSYLLSAVRTLSVCLQWPLTKSCCCRCRRQLHVHQIWACLHLRLPNGLGRHACAALPSHVCHQCHFRPHCRRRHAAAGRWFASRQCCAHARDRGGSHKCSQYWRWLHDHAAVRSAGPALLTECFRHLLILHAPRVVLCLTADHEWSATVTCNFRGHRIMQTRP